MTKEKKKRYKQVLYNQMSNNNTIKGFHWGHGIILTYIFFGAFMAYFYLHMSQEKIELVGENYYADGQAYQEKINLHNQVIPLSHQIQVKSIANNQYHLIQLPTGCDSASVQFFRPSNAQQDKTIHWKKEQNLNWTFATEFLIKGPWKRTINWTIGGQTYIQEQRILATNK